MDGNTLVVLLVQVVFVFLLLQELRSLRSSRVVQEDYWSVLRGIRPVHFLVGGLVLGLVFGTYLFLVMLHPFFALGWLALLGGGEGGVLSSDIAWGAWWGLALGGFLATLVVVLLPLLVLGEEGIFRSGEQDRGVLHRVFRALLFGLCHVVTGIPVGLALALSWGGWYFSRAYLQAFGRSTGTLPERELQSLRASASAHLAYNMGVVIVAGILWTLQ